MHVTEDVTATLRAEAHGHEPIFCLEGHCIDRPATGQNGKGYKEDVSYTLNATDRHAVYDARGNGDGQTCPTITGDHENRITDYTAICCIKDDITPKISKGGYNSP